VAGTGDPARGQKKIGGKKSIPNPEEEAYEYFHAGSNECLEECPR
jgi:hypothetical protein